MAYAPPDPKKVEAKVERFRRDRQAAIAAEKERARIRSEIRKCYAEHTPPQLQNVAGRIAAHENSLCVSEFPQVIGKSCGGGVERPLLLCWKALEGVA